MGVEAFANSLSGNLSFGRSLIGNPVADFLSRPFVTQEEITELSQAQEALKDEGIRKFLGQFLLYLNFLTEEFSRSIGSLIGVNLFSDMPGVDRGIKKNIKMQSFQIANSFVRYFRVIKEALTQVSSEHEDVSFPPMLQALFANISVFLERIKVFVEQIHFHKSVRFLGFKFKSATFEYQKPNRGEGSFDPVSDLFALRDDVDNTVAGAQESLNWLQVFNAMALFQEKCADWLSKVGCEEAGEADERETRGVGRFDVEGLHHPATAFAVKTQREGGEKISVPQERLVFDPQYKIIVFAGVNGAGKTHVVQAITWAHIKNQVGAPIFGKEGAKVPMVSDILTHQPRDTNNRRGERSDGNDDYIGKFGEELQELRRLCDQVKPGMLVAIDEMLLATGQEGVEVYSKEIIDEFVARGARVLLVTHNAELIHSLAAQDNCLVFEAGVEEGGKKPTYQFSQRTADALTPSEDYRTRRDEIFRQVWRKEAEAPSR